MIARRLSRWHAGALALGIAVAPVLAQTGSATPDVQPNDCLPALPARSGPRPVLVFERIGEIALPGPVVARPGWVADGLVVIPVEGGLARVAPEAGATPSLGAATDLPLIDEWVVSPNGKRRYRATKEGRVEAERRHHEGKPWHRSWRIVAPNSILSPPVVIGPRLCYAGLDDCVTCVRASNGHRLWAVDLGDRLSRSLSCWPACGDRSPEEAILLAVPDDGASVVALDAYDGHRIATFELPPHDRFAGSALVAAGNTIAVARKGYDDREAALVLLRLVPPPAPAPSGSLPYNGGSPSRTGPSGR